MITIVKKIEEALSALTNEDKEVLSDKEKLSKNLNRILNNDFKLVDQCLKTVWFDSEYTVLLTFNRNGKSLLVEYYYLNEIDLDPKVGIIGYDNQGIIYNNDVFESEVTDTIIKFFS